MDLIGQHQIMTFSVRLKPMGGKVFICQYLIWVLLLLGQLHGYRSCVQKERVALLDLKKSVITREEEELSGSIFTTWTNDTKSDCCKWIGVTCNRTNRRVTRIAIDGVARDESALLNLSLLHPFEEVRSLDLSNSGFNGLFDHVEGYNSLKRLKKLEILDLSHNEFDNSIFPFLNTATSLTNLFLDEANNMDGPFPIKALRNLTSLQLLNLGGNRFNGSMTTGEFPHLKKLKSLYLAGNELSSSIELQGLKNLANLEILDLSFNSIDETVPRQVICELKNLRELDLKWSFLVGQLPLCLGSLNKLRVLDLSYNQFSGNLPASFSNLKSLRYLSLSQNHFKGFFSFNPLANLTNLKVLKISSTSDMLQVETKSTWQPKFQLSIAALPFCSMEKIPDFLIYQKNLRLVDLSSNRIFGNLPTWLLENNPQLEVLQLQNNSFTIFQTPTLLGHKLQLLDFSANDIGSVLPANIGHMLPNLIHMNGSDNMFQGNFPSSIGEMKNISFLDLSHNNLSGELPRSFLTGCSSLKNLKLSYNKFSGHFLPTRTRLTSLNVLKMDNNLFTGKIGIGLLSLVVLTILDISNNFLTGSIPSWIPDSSLHLTMIVLSNNLLEGMLPPSLLAIQQLSFLDLSGNLLSGELPSSHVSSMYGINLFLQNNSFTGPIPSTLLEKAKVVDLRNNKLSGSIPQFVNTMELRILLLRGNDLTGTIPRKLCDLSSVRILDLSDNKLSGFIPSCLYNLSTTLGEEQVMSSYSVEIHIGDSVFQLEMFKSTLLVEEVRVEYGIYLSVEIEFASKQRYDSYTGASEFIGGTLDYMYGLDLSNNELSGAIPAELGDLSKLRAMNLSRNFLSSSIPDSFSKLKDIESLDLSFNMLHGNIPHQLTNLTSLAVFNVSYNNLSGIIPQGVQFHTFKEDSYLGNPFLCGPPTDRSCETKKSSEEGDNGGEEDDDEAFVDMLVFYWSTSSTYVVALIGIILLVRFDCSWGRAWIHLVDAFIASAKSICS